MKKLLLATAAVIAVASPALAETANNGPAMVQNMFTMKDPGSLTLDGCRNYAINVYTKAHARDLEVKENTVWAYMDIEDRTFTLSVWCEVKPQYAVVFLSAAGPDYKGADAVLDNVIDTWKGKNDKPAATPDVTAAAKTKKHKI